MIAIARGIRRYDGRAAFTTWAYRVATNACLDELRRRSRRPVPGAVGFVAADDPPPAAPAAPDGQVGLDGVLDRLTVDAALARLPHEFRVAVVLRDLCDLDYAEIGQVLGVPPGTVKSRIARGRAQLADLLGNPSPAADRPTTSP